MPDITQLFRKYVDVMEEDENTKFKRENDREDKRRPVEKYSIKDTFAKECLELLAHITELDRVIVMLEPSYQSEADLTEQEKDDFDTESRLQLQQYIEKFKFLEKYESKRQELIGYNFLSNKGSEALSNFLGSGNYDLKLFHITNNQHRSRILQSLNLKLAATSFKLANMQQKRLTRKRELESIDFNSQLYVPFKDVVASVSQTPAIETTQEEIKQYEETISKLSQEQLQVLETEHEELLNHKNKELEKVQKLTKTVTEIASLQNELATHLQVQTENINTLLDNHDDIEVDIQQGNKQLRKAQERGGKSARMITYLSITFGLLILLLDYIN